MTRTSVEYYLHIFAQVAVFVGALTWGSLGFFGKNAIVALVPKGWLTFAYKTIGVAAVYLIWCRFRVNP